MQQVDKLFIAKHCKDNSTFIAYLMPYNIYEATLEELREEHKKAVHFVRASRILNEYKQIVESSSDDGEPKGSSGVPVLNVMRGSELVESAIIVVRYFGGKLLGVGGLVRAYSKAALKVLEIADLLPYEPLEQAKLEISFSKIEHAKYLSKKLNIKISNISFENSSATLMLEGKIEALLEFKKMLGG